MRTRHGDTEPRNDEDAGHQPVPRTLEELPPAERAKTKLFAGLVFVVAGAALQVLVPTAVLTCERGSPRAPSCELEWRILFDLVPIRQATIAALHGVDVRRLISERTNQRFARPNYVAILATDQGGVRMNVLGQREAVEDAIATVRAYLGNPEEPRLDAELKPAGLFKALRWIGTGIFVFGVLYWLPSPSSFRSSRTDSRVKPPKGAR